MPTLDFKDKSAIRTPCNACDEGGANNNNLTQLQFKKWIGQTPTPNRLFGMKKALSQTVRLDGTTIIRTA
jgi:hypothetical protein